MDDKQISDRIGALIDEEHALERAGDPDRSRLGAIEVELDTCWDLLRQRRARRVAGADPDDAQPRTERTVEGYLQ
ncbi:MAG: DUF2630 family protein [Mycobacteriaceae bacterium]|nr:DUF2630 family protein [Mycobacteriaceae bacterium]